MSDQSKNMQDFASIWDYQARDMWGKDYAQALADLLKTYDTTMILDCAGGTGFPAIEFKQQGLSISYSDGSQDMLTLFNEKRFEKKLTIPTYLSSWQALPDRVPYSYDAVLCRGNSLLFMGAYLVEDPQSHETVLANMELALKGMFSKVADDGLLYIDIPKLKHAKPETPYTFTGTDSLTFKVKTTVSYDPKTQLRTTKDCITHLLSGTESNIVAHNYAIEEHELFDLLAKVGFKRVEKSPIKEAFFINAYMAFKQ